MCVRGLGAAPGSDLAGMHEEIQQLKAAVEVLTNATHLMAIPTATSSLGEPGELDPALCCAVPVLCCAVSCCAVLCHTMPCPAQDHTHASFTA